MKSARCLPIRLKNKAKRKNSDPTHSFQKMFGYAEVLLQPTIIDIDPNTLTILNTSVINNQATLCNLKDDICRTNLGFLIFNIPTNYTAPPGKCKMIPRVLRQCYLSSPSLRCPDSHLAFYDYHTRSDCEQHLGCAEITTDPNPNIYDPVTLDVGFDKLARQVRLR